MHDNVHFLHLPYELGILHYASDTPYTRGKNLGAGSLSYFGMDSTYGCTIAMARRIFERELDFIKNGAIQPIGEETQQESTDKGITLG